MSLYIDLIKKNRRWTFIFQIVLKNNLVENMACIARRELKKMKKMNERNSLNMFKTIVNTLYII